MPVRSFLSFIFLYLSSVLVLGIGSAYAESSFVFKSPAVCDEGMHAVVAALEKEVSIEQKAGRPQVQFRVFYKLQRCENGQFHGIDVSSKQVRVYLRREGASIWSHFFDGEKMEGFEGYEVQQEPVVFEPASSWSEEEIKDFLSKTYDTARVTSRPLIEPVSKAKALFLLAHAFGVDAKTDTDPLVLRGVRVQITVPLEKLLTSSKWALYEKGQAVRVPLEFVLNFEGQEFPYEMSFSVKQ
ncbi:MAG: hypothetical protein D6797_04955 [Bdellovibrio sp.]|nr:MAG: hypothetical protein D6797_04955 [Bdellovibrio sp.]